MNLQKKLLLPVALGFCVSFATADESGTWAYLKEQHGLYQAVWLGQFLKAPRFKTFLDLVRDNRVRSVKAFIRAFGIDVNDTWVCQETPHAESPLILAVQRERIEIVRTLLENGANVFYKDNLGYTALNYAHDAVIKALLEEYAGKSTAAQLA